MIAPIGQRMVQRSDANFLWLPMGEQSSDFSEHCQAEGVLIRNFAPEGVRIRISTPAENGAFLTVVKSWVGGHRRTNRTESAHPRVNADDVGERICDPFIIGARVGLVLRGALLKQRGLPVQRMLASKDLVQRLGARRVRPDAVTQFTRCDVVAHRERDQVDHFLSAMENTVASRIRSLSAAVSFSGPALY